MSCCSRGEKVHEGETGAHGCPRWEGLCLQMSGQGAWVLMPQASRTLGMAQRPLFGGGCGHAGREKLRYRLEGLEMLPKQEG